MHDWPLVLMREREVSQSSVDAESIEYPLFGVSVLTCIKIKAGHCEKTNQATWSRNRPVPNQVLAPNRRTRNAAPADLTTAASTEFNADTVFFAPPDATRKP
jgi:hypothetical protein